MEASVAGLACSLYLLSVDGKKNRTAAALTITEAAHRQLVEQVVSSVQCMVVVP